MKQFLIFLVLFLFNLNAFSQSFKENSIGIVYLNGETDSEYEIEIVFPFHTLTGYSIEKPLMKVKEIMSKFDTELPIFLFDKNGILSEINGKKSFEIVFWCENDGGIQFRPRLILKVQKDKFNRNLMKDRELQDIACFALINHNELKTYGQVSAESLKKDVRMTGDLNSDGILEALIWVVPDDAQNCDSFPANNLMIFLNFNGRNYRMRCCGP